MWYVVVVPWVVSKTSPTCIPVPQTPAAGRPPALPSSQLTHQPLLLSLWLLQTFRYTMILRWQWAGIPNVVLQLQHRPTSHPSSCLNQQYIKKSFQNYEEELRDAKNIATQSTTTIADIRNQRNSKVKHNTTLHCACKCKKMSMKW